MIALRQMTADDVPLGMRLKNQAGWNQTEADWRRFLELEPEGCFVAERNGQPAGTATTCVFDSVGWIAMVLVDETQRHRGIGSRLVERALAYLQRRGVRTVRLDATPLGRPIYRRLGFVEEYELTRLEGTVTAGGGDGANDEQVVEGVAASQMENLIALDRQVTGTDRRRLIERLARECDDAVGLSVSEGRLPGYVMLRQGSRATQIGPAGALTAEVGRALGNWALRQCAGRPVFIDVPCENGPAIQWAEAAGLVPQRCLTRMCLGEPIHDRRELLWASSGPEKG